MPVSGKDDGRPSEYCEDIGATTETKTRAGVVLLGFWHGQFGTYATYLKDKFKVPGYSKNIRRLCSNPRRTKRGLSLKKRWLV